MTVSNLLPLLVLPLASIAFSRNHLPDWAFMFVLSFSIFFGFKWLTYRRAQAKGANPDVTTSLGYLIAWVGMDAVAFFDGGPVIRKPPLEEWVAALLKTLLGAMILWILPKQFFPQQSLLAGYIGLVGFIIIIFFGFFHILSLAWRQNGVNASPIMNSPILARSPSDFWSNRWNLAFRDLDRIFIFRPVFKSVGFVAAIIVVFLFSGLVHDLVISFPVDAGYGLPTVYFLIQAGGVFLEKSGFGIKNGLNRGLKGRLFAVLLILTPVVLLFHPAAVENIMIPFMKVIRAV